MKKLLQILFILLNTFFATNAQGYLGVVIRDYDQDNVLGARIINILDDGAAKLAGLKENDIITEFNQKTINNKNTLVDLLKKSSWGDAVKLNIIRNSEILSVDLNLGYKKDTKTYQLHKTQIKDEQHWFFEDDSTNIVLDKNDQTVSIEKKGSNCVLDKWYVNEAYKESELPQCFLDLNDKLYAITRIKQDQARRNVKIDYITYIKTLIENDSDKSIKVEPLKELSLETFSIFPNPNNGQFTIKLESSDYSPFNVNIFDVTGKKVIQEYVGTFEGMYLKQYDFRTLARGTYLIQVIQNEKRIAKKILIQ